MNLLELPNIMLMQIFEHLTYEEVAKNRILCKKIDLVCQHILNCGFNKIVRQHTVCLKRIKSLLPRRESERRNHCLARHADILTCIETRISMLSMTYSKYMDLNLCCFIPGRVLDEIFRILRLIVKTNKPLRPHEVLQELRDISSMAIEHFDEKIANSLKKTFTESGSKPCTTHDSSKQAMLSPLKISVDNSYATGGGWNPPFNSTNNFLPSRCDSIRPRVTSLLGVCSPSLNTTANASAQTQGCPEARATMMYFKKLEMEYRKGILKMHRMHQIQVHQTRRLRQAISLVTDLNMQMVELKKRIEEVDAKNRELSASMKHINVGGEQTPVSSSAKAVVSVSEGDESKLHSVSKRRLDDIKSSLDEDSNISIKKSKFE